MTDSSSDIDELDIAAAQVVAAMLEFAQIGLPVAIRHHEALGGRLGDVGFKLLPDDTVVARSEAALALIELPKPVAIASLATRGLFGVWRLTDEPPGPRGYLERARQANQEQLQKAVESHGLGTDSLIRLQVGDTLAVFPLAALVRCLRDYVPFVSWVLHPPRPEHPSQARLLLIRADGLCSTGANVLDGRPK